mmetsp:Transcript_40363/g.121622  ORF Transcript_40363/g.121622 Transcript_40363/m.121622 type:complete len:259 (-) Transcript_40363:381-1157(-)
MSSSGSGSCCGGGGPVKGFCPFSLFLFAATAGTYLYARTMKSDSSDREDGGGKSESAAKEDSAEPYTVVFVLGGPGSGKGTQCELLSSRLDFAHLSAGDLLRAERNSGSELADLINSKIAAGQIVPAEITVDLLEGGMAKERKESGRTKFLIDGFPRSEGNVSVWDERLTATGKADVKFVLFLDCPEDTMTGRLLERGKSSGRNDDKLDVIRKRFETFRGESMPIVERYETKGKVRKVKADRAIEDVYKDVSKLMEGL